MSFVKFGVQAEWLICRKRPEILKKIKICRNQILPKKSNKMQTFKKVRRNGIIMTKLVQIIVLAAAAVVVVYTGFSAFTAKKGDQVTQFLDSIDVVKEFKAQHGEKNTASSEQISPLVKQAQAFSLYLDPPPPPRPDPKPRELANRDLSSRPSPPTTTHVPTRVQTNYEVVGTVVSLSNPADSRAIIDLPGAGLKVVRPGEEINHTVIEEIKDGSLMIKIGSKVEELLAKRDPVPSLIKDSPNHIYKLQGQPKNDNSELSLKDLVTSDRSESPATRLTPSTSSRTNRIRPSTSSRSRNLRPAALTPSSRRGSATSSRRVPAVRKPSSSSRRMPPEMSPEEQEKVMEELMGELSKMKKATGGEDMDELMETVREMHSEMGNDRDPGTKGSGAKRPE